MRYGSRVGRTVLALVALSVCTAADSGGQWAKQPGDRVRDDFGPTLGQVATTCRGACGGGCPSACAATVAYECAGRERLRRVRTYTCGTHQGCREHDDCLDRCRQRQRAGFDCDAQCHADAVQRWGGEAATSWASGGGPYDGTTIFEYTRGTPQGPEPVFRCPDGAQLACGEGGARCVSGVGGEATPVFDSYAGSTGTLRVSSFRSGRLCRAGEGVSAICEPAIDIEVTGDARCEQAGASRPCTWYGFQFDYANADPSAPLLCSSSGAGEDPLGGIVRSALAAMPADQMTELGAALGSIQRELESGRSLKDVLSGFTVPPAGKPAAAAGPTRETSPGVPRSVSFTQANGHLLVRMYELSDTARPGTILVRDVRCTHNGSPALETTFRLRFSDR